MTYIGPFLRMNSLNKVNIKNQLLHFSKESLKYITLYSKAGITTSPFAGDYSSIITDNNIEENFSPLLCVYKKGEPYLRREGRNHVLPLISFNREILINANGYMTLSLLKLCDYYKDFTDDYLKQYFKIYMSIIKKQLDFYTNNLRNSAGYFVDKRDVADSITDGFKIINKGEDFDFSDQSIMILAFYRYSLIAKKTNFDKDYKHYNDFAKDILNSLLNFEDELMEHPFEDLLILSLMLTEYYNDSKDTEALKLCETLFDKLYKNYSTEILDEVYFSSLLFLTADNLYKITDDEKYKKLKKKSYENLEDCYDKKLEVYHNPNGIKYYMCDEIILYIIVMYLKGDNSLNILENVYKNMAVSPNMFLSFPKAPNVDSPERYYNKNIKTLHMVEDENFRHSSFEAPEDIKVAPVITKELKFSKKKKKFKKERSIFDSETNMLSFFFILNFLDIRTFLSKEDN